MMKLADFNGWRAGMELTSSVGEGFGITGMFAIPKPNFRWEPLVISHLVEVGETHEDHDFGSTQEPQCI